MSAEFPVMKVGEQAFAAFVSALASEGPSEGPTMDHFKDQTFRSAYLRAAAITMQDVISQAVPALQDESLGMAVVDIPQLSGTSEADSQINGFACAAAIFSSLARASLVPPNNVPFGLHLSRTTPRENEDGSTPVSYTPDTEFGFHTDGITRSGGLYVPDTIGVYNLLLTFQRPGNFHWLPYSRWPEFSKYAETLELNSAVAIEIAPAAYLGKNGKEIVGGARVVEVPVVKLGKESRRPVFFCNGRLAQYEGDAHRVADLMREMRASLSAGGRHFSVPQRERRLIVVRNSGGFHSRDRLLMPQPDCELSRVFARFIDDAGEIFGPIKQWGASSLAEQ